MTSAPFYSALQDMTTRQQLQQTFCDRLFRHTTDRDDAIVTKHMFDHHEMDVIYAMNEATLFDSFFNYLQKIDLFPF